VLRRVVRGEVVLFAVVLTLLFCVGCNSTDSSQGDADVDVPHPDVDLSDADSDVLSPDAVGDDDAPCPPYTGECEFAQTTVCRDDSVYQCVQELVDGCVVAHSYRLIESCAAGCEVVTAPAAGVAGVAKCGELPYDGCPPYTGECEFEQTTVCRNGSVYRCVHTLLGGVCQQSQLCAD
jgi:hypothetical protein